MIKILFGNSRKTSDKFRAKFVEIDVQRKFERNIRKF